ncbi:putative transposase [Gordonia namibiensis NBRC 108229]|uniref:Putative transposase n=1 Tax=Gordonia namibiensis NBRC 108229 TaxID=1208314 RepID=K6W2V3_9ACTN|nr:putative transposase [Gordonia namibiensis NBRC 108229]
MFEASPLSRGAKRRNDRLTRFREIVGRDYAVVAIDLAAKKQVIVVADHDSRILARKTFTFTPWKLGPAIAWARTQAEVAGFAGIVLACEPTGHRWKVVADLAAAVGAQMVCVQPMVVARARETEDFTRDKSDDKDALLIARLTTQLHIYLPEHADQHWARLRHLGVRRTEQLTRRAAARQQIRDLLDSAWPQVLDSAAQPLDSATWLATMTIIGCDPRTITAYRSPARARTRLRARLHRELPRWGAHRIHGPILTAIITSAFATTMPPERTGALERAHYGLNDFHHATVECRQVESHMLAVLDELQLTALASSIPGVTAVSVAAILAETGDLSRFDSARAVVKHAGLCPRENSSGSYQGTTTISGRGRPRLRTAAWRAAFGALRHNPVYAARYQHLTTRTHNRLQPNQAYVAIAAALLRQLHVVITTATPWDPTLAGAPQSAEVSAA